MNNHIPPFHPTKPLYDQSTLTGRARHFYTITDPRSLFYTTKQLEQAEDILKAFKANKLPPGVTNSDLWKSRRVIESMVHPETHEVIPAILRFSAYAPMNILIVSLMVLPTTIQSIPRTIAIHWFNQSYNCAVNYANRNISNPISTRRLIEGYVGAVGASLSIALGATYATAKASTYSPATRSLIRATLPFSAVVFAGWANVALIRRNELTDGVDVFDHDGNLIGKSKVAGRDGIMKCCLARFVWNIPAMIVPTVVMDYLATKPAWIRATTPRTRIGVEVLLISAFLLLGVPPALGLYPQIDSIPVERLEEKFHHLRDSSGNPIKKVFYNKGL